MRRCGLSNCLVILENPRFSPHELRHPDRERIRLLTRAADVAERFVGQQLIRANPADAAFFPGLGDGLGEVGTHHRADVVALPYVVVLVFVGCLVAQTLTLKFRREFGVVAPVEFDHLDERVAGKAKPLFHCRLFALGVPRHPQFRVPAAAFFPQGGDQRVPCLVCDGFGLIHPGNENTPLRLDRRDVAIQAGKDELDPPILAAHVVLPDVVILGQPFIILNRPLDFLKG